MLYIHRLIGRTKFGVADTDDNTVTEVTLNDLRYMVLDLKMEIVGVTIEPNGVLTVIPHTPQADSAQIKLKMLKGVDSRLEDGVLKYINFDNRKGELSLRLSEFCTVISDNVLARFTGTGKKDGLVTLILDDKLILRSSKCFTDILNYSYLSLNLEEVTNEEIAQRAYAPYLGQAAIRFDGDDIVPMHIIDNIERYSQYQARQALNAPLAHSIRISGVVRQYLDVAIAPNKKKIIGIPNNAVSWTSDDVSSLLRYNKRMIENFDEFVCTNRTFIVAFGIDVSRYSNLDSGLVKKLTNYIRLGGNDAKIIEAWHNICSRLL